MRAAIAAAALLACASAHAVSTFAFTFAGQVVNTAYPRDVAGTVTITLADNADGVYSGARWLDARVNGLLGGLDVGAIYQSPFGATFAQSATVRDGRIVDLSLVAFNDFCQSVEVFGTRLIWITGSGDESMSAPLIAVAAVPEPSVWLVLLAGVGAIVRRRSAA